VNEPSLSVSRREDREAALAWLYESDMNGDPVPDVVDRNRLDIDDYDVEIAVGVWNHRLELDALIEDVAQDWTVDRMPAVDRAILRIGTWELAHRFDVPTPAVVSEAVALANQYSTERSAPFINGVLVQLAARLRDDASTS
jgi:N utilization substance protein B